MQTCVLSWGSSPHTRGAPDGAGFMTSDGGIIPAYAGSTQDEIANMSGIRDHPRIRGEHKVFSSHLSWIQGSSPHTRGARPDGQHVPRHAGIIPAYAGSTVSWRRMDRISRDHPRIRGEHYGVRLAITSPRGSSPHTRGARHRVAVEGLQEGIIPAYAGSTTVPFELYIKAGDHPRIRGEHNYNQFLDELDEGSSPHTRGAPRQPRPARRVRGIIPAYAGSTPSPPSARRCGRDHPRIRGEHRFPAAPRSVGAGSSPHTRGARPDGQHVQRHAGIIPAYAGSTLKYLVII